LVAATSCLVIANSVTLAEIESEELNQMPNWRKIIESGLKQSKVTVQEAAATAMAAVSKLIDCSALAKR
jgi:tubulin-specific chaperone D